MCFRGLAKTPAPCASKTSAKRHFCCGCPTWVHKKCNGISGSLTPDTSFMCKRCTGQGRPVEGKTIIKVTVGKGKLDVVSDCLFSVGGYEVAFITRCRVEWGVAWRSGKGTPQPPIKMARPCRKWYLSTQTWTEVITMGYATLGLTEAHPSDRKAWDSRL